jgi:hypothetical protein
MRKLAICRKVGMKQLVVLIVVGLAASCSCSETGLQGEADADDPGTDTGVDPVPLCWDMDGDGHEDELCGGDDCDDSDPTIHPGAEDVCLDGVDRDCDGIVDGPMLMGDVIQVSSNLSDWTVAPISEPVWTGSTYAVSWGQIEEVGAEMTYYLGHVGSEGGWVATREVDGLLSLTWTGSSFGTMWSDSDDILMRVMDPLGESLTSDVVVMTDRAHEALGLVWTGEHFGLFWVDTSGSWQNVMHARVSYGGEILSEPFYITSISRWEMCDADQWSLTWTGHSAAVTWKANSYGEGRDLYFVNWQVDGTTPGVHVVLEEDSRDIYQTMAWTGSEFGLVRATEPGMDPFSNFYFTRLDEEGSRVAADVEIGSEWGFMPQIAWTGSEYAVLYLGQFGDSLHLALARGDATGSFDEGAPIAEVHQSPVGRHRMAWSGSEFGVTWQDRVSGTFQAYFCRIGLCD